ncbi:MAG: class IV adenylate cyclase [Acidobacteriota bacterium]
MARNVEIKARIEGLGEIESRVRKIADDGPFDLAQDDTFFASPRGRLKLRELVPDRGELIFYLRQDVSGPKLSQYSIVRTSEPAELRRTLDQALGIAGRVRKRRRVYLIENTRVHLDEVEGLGTFVELEVVLSETQTVQEGEVIARRLMAQLGILETSLVEGAYLDLITAQ